MNVNEIRQGFLDFMVKRGYKVIEPAPLVLEGDPTTLFTGAGMQPLLPYLLGKEHPWGNLLTDAQPCLRAQDIEEVGDNRHTTFFEMMGDWSLDGFNKEEQIRWYFEFVTEELKLDPEKIYVTAFIGDEKNGIPRDTETAEIWVKLFAEKGIEAKTAEIGSAANGDVRGMKPGERIFFYDDGENWWSRGGGIETTPIGDPCGPDNEFFYDFGKDAHDASFGEAHPASDSGRFIEFGNKVWMQYRRLDDGSFEKLDKGRVDQGSGLDRLAAVAMGTSDVFRTSSFSPIITELEQISGKKYADEFRSMRVIADHLRGATFLAGQGLAPSNKEQGYVMRRLIRRAILKALNLGVEEDFVARIVPVVIESLGAYYGFLKEQGSEILAVLMREEKAFRQTIRRGLKELGKLRESGLTGLELFKLQDTYGFPLELSVEEARRQELKLSENWRAEFETALAEQRERSKTASKGMFKGGLEDHGEQTVKYHTAAHLLLAAMQKLIDPKMEQRGANITAERLRFDFGIERKLGPAELAELEKQVNEWIEADLPVSFAEYDKAYARDVLKAHGQFWDRYPEKVTVYTIGDDDAPVSREICGGPHVARTGELGYFKIVKEESSARGVRRIKAILVSK